MGHEVLLKTSIDNKYRYRGIFLDIGRMGQWL